jgi:hypothetical protein
MRIITGMVLVVTGPVHINTGPQQEDIQTHINHRQVGNRKVINIFWWVKTRYPKMSFLY